MSSPAAAKEDQNKVVLEQLETMKSCFSDYCETLRDEIDPYFDFDNDVTVMGHQDSQSTFSMVSGERRYTI